MLIEIESLTHRFDDVTVLNNICFSDDIHTLAIIGPSGEGKSTLLRILAGLLVPTQGSVRIDGQEVPTDEAARTRYRASLGFVFQDGGLFQHLSARENVALPLRVVHGMEEGKAEHYAMELLERFGLAQEADKLPVQLSGGQRQRVAIVRAVAPRPHMLLLDEPTSALDPEYTNEVLDLLRDLKEEGTQFITVTHEMGFARHACDKVACLYAGQLLEYGPSEQVFSNPASPELQRFLGRLLEWSL